MWNILTSIGILGAVIVILWTQSFIGILMGTLFFVAILLVQILASSMGPGVS